MKVADKLLIEVADTIEEEGQEEVEGWRNTKHPKLSSRNRTDQCLHSGIPETWANETPFFHCKKRTVCFYPKILQSSALGYKSHNITPQT